jgi:hypothetical protein
MAIGSTKPAATTKPKRQPMPVALDEAAIRGLRLVTPQELAKHLCVKVSWIYQRTAREAQDPIPVVWVGRWPRFHIPTVHAWLPKRREVGTGE